jgi:hypothetical protein
MRFMNFKIAAIVLVVIVTALILVGIPQWLFEVIRQGPAERTIYALTPDSVISRCGMPISDKAETHPGAQSTAMVFREMYYKAGTGTVALTFVRSDEGTKEGRWVLNAMNDPESHFRYGTAKSKLAALPCLALK